MAQVVENPSENAGDCQRLWLDPWVGKIPWRREWQPTPVFLPGESHGWRSLAGCSPRGHKELATTELLGMQHMQRAVHPSAPAPSPGLQPRQLSVVQGSGGSRPGSSPGILPTMAEESPGRLQWAGVTQPLREG